MNKAIAFKAALKLSDTDAAAAHIDVGRRILRQRAEAGSRTSDVEQRKVQSFAQATYLHLHGIACVF